MAGKMLKLTLSHCGQAVFVNPLLMTSVCAATPPDEREAVPADYVPPKAYVFVAGDNEGIAVSETAEQVAELWEDRINA